MGRNLAPQWKRYRRLGLEVPGKGGRRNYPPGQHGNKRKPRLTEYALQLREKQKAKLLYGIMEKQFLNYFKKASNRDGNTGELLMISLEKRMDNVVYRAGLASTRRQARQLVTHAQFDVNGTKCNIPSREMKPGDVITVRDKKKSSAYFTQLPNDIKMHEAPEWLEVNKADFEIKVQADPKAENAEAAVTVNLIVEYYSR